MTTKRKLPLRSRSRKQKKISMLELNKEEDIENHDLAKALEELGEFEKTVNGQIYKYNAYHKAAYSISHCPEKITSGQQAMSLEGVGKKIAGRIDEYIETGKIKELEDMKHSDYYKCVNELNRVMGIGPSHARKFYREGIRSIEDLRKIEDELTHEQKIGIKYLQDFEKQIPRDEMKRVEKFLIDEIEMIDDKYIVHMCGSYRRGADFSNDIDILITHPYFISKSYAKAHNISQDDEKYVIQYKASPRPLMDKIINKLTDLEFLSEDVIAYGDAKFMGICSLADDSPFRRIDIRIFPHDEYYTALLYYTGSQTFNHEMRKHALEKGFTLNEYSLRRVDANGRAGKPLHIKSEKEIFDYLEMDYKRPDERNMD